MSSIINRLDFGEINTGSGQLGLVGYTTSSTANLGTFSTYCNAYYFDIATRTPILRLPVIGTSGVIVGWSTTLIINYPIDTTASTLNMNAVNTIQILDSTGTTVTRVNVYPAASVANKAIVQIRVNAIAEPNTWLIENDLPYWATLAGTFKYVYMGGTINYSNGIPAPRPSGATSRMTVSISVSTNINVLFVTPVLIPFATNVNLISNCVDKLYYNPNIANTIYTVGVAGMYYFKFTPVLTNASGGNSSNVRFAILLNGVTQLPGIEGTSSTGSDTNNYLYVYRPLIIGDTFSVIAGKSVVSPGTTSVATTSTFSVEWICP